MTRPFLSKYLRTSKAKDWAASNPYAAILVGMTAVFCLIGCGWGLPATESWSADSISPRSVGLLAVALPFQPGRFHTYPPLHMLLLTLLSLPVILFTLARAGTAPAKFIPAMIAPLPMTIIESTARLVAAFMAVGIVLNIYRIFARSIGKRGGGLAALFVAINACIIYYAHTGNVDIPYLFWASLALVELDATLGGEDRLTRASAFFTLAILTKDQAAGIAILPAICALIFVLRSPVTNRVKARQIAAASLTPLALYAVVSGAITNPSGFRARLSFLFGPASQEWEQFPRTREGTKALLGALWSSITEMSGRLPAVLAALGVVIVLAGIARTTVPKGQLRLLMPFAAAVGFTLLFNLGARRSEVRFLLPQAMLFLPYAGLAVEQALRRAAGARGGVILVGTVAALAIGEGVFELARMEGTLLVDARYAATDFLRALPANTLVEIHGGAHFFPQLPAHLRYRRRGVDALTARAPMAVTDVVDAQLGPPADDVDVVLLSAEISFDRTGPDQPDPSTGRIAPFTEFASRRFYRRLQDGEFPFARSLRSVCRLPFGIRCHKVHGSTGEEVWIYSRKHPATPGLRTDE